MCCPEVQTLLLPKQVKRIHEYKRQLLNVMSIIHRYSEIKAMSPEEREQVSCTCNLVVFEVASSMLSCIVLDQGLGRVAYCVMLREVDRDAEGLSQTCHWQVVPRVCVIGGKAAPGYEMAKRIIKLVNAVGERINADQEVGDLLKAVFMPDYNVSSAEVIIPGQA